MDIKKREIKNMPHTSIGHQKNSAYKTKSNAQEICMDIRNVLWAPFHYMVQEYNHRHSRKKDKIKQEWFDASYLDWTLASNPDDSSKPSRMHKIHICAYQKAH
jgi:hypothetical protein